MLLSGYRIACPCCGRQMLVIPQEGAEPLVAIIPEAGTFGMPSTGGLSRRELQILQMVAEARTDAAIAADLCLSIKTVKTHTSSILTKLNVHNRTAAVTEGLRRGLVHLPEGQREA